MTAVSSTTSAQRISYNPAAVQRLTLDNGLRVWIEPRPESESITALLVVRVGSRYETPANNGISHFVEHMVFDGIPRSRRTKSIKSATSSSKKSSGAMAGYSIRSMRWGWVMNSIETSGARCFPARR